MRGRKYRNSLRFSVLFVSLCVLALSVACSNKVAPDPPERTFDVTYQVAIRELPTEAKTVYAWVPLPLSDEHQALKRYVVAGDWPQKILKEPEYGNEFVRIDVSHAAKAQTKEIDLSVNFRVNRKSYRVLGGDGSADSIPREGLARFLAPDTLVPIDGKIAEEARRVGGSLEDPLERMRALYDHIVESVVYDKSGQGWGRGDALYVCDKRTGNCTDFHSLFIGEARALGIPARFVMGLPLPRDASKGEIPGYHCWAEFYIDGRGWIPVDASEAHKNRAYEEAFFGGLDANRVAFTIGRDIRIPEASAGPINYVIYPHVEVDGKPYSKIATRFAFNEISS